MKAIFFFCIDEYDTNGYNFHNSLLSAYHAKDCAGHKEMHIEKTAESVCLQKDLQPVVMVFHLQEALVPSG